MLLPRIIPTLLISEGSLVKTKQFKKYKYLGDPLNTVRMFNEFEVDELVIIDIDATTKDKPINLNLLKKIASVSRMPIAYGGGISSFSKAKAIVSLGIEKIILSSFLIDNYSFAEDLSSEIGAQSVVSCIDFAKSRFSPKYNLFSHSATKKHRIPIISHILNLQKHGVGELIFHNIRRDGTRSGYDFDFLSSVYPHVHVPCSFIGGARSFGDFTYLFHNFPHVAASASSCFLLHGTFDTPLINYPSFMQKQTLYPIKKH